MKWSPDEIDLLRSEYAGKLYSDQIDLDGLSIVLRRHKTNICRKARALGLTNLSRQTKAVRLADCRINGEQLAASTSVRIKGWLKDNQHPRGMLGKTHSDEFKTRASVESAKRWAKKTEVEKSKIVFDAIKSRVLKHGLQPRTGVTWKGGKRTIGGVEKYYRSRWEANYARYLQWLKERGEIEAWVHEPETFWFESVKRGTRSYTPDFLVTEKNGAQIFHEVKGWMDQRSRTKLKRFAKYYPMHKVILVEAAQYKAISNSVSKIIEGWE